MPTIISVENLSKSYRLGQIGTGTFAHDLSVWWAKVRGKPNPMLKIGESEFVGQETEDGRPGGGPPSSILWALKDVSFTVEQGEVLGIIGRNGAGKSTLLKILSRVTAPTSGRIRVKGRVASLLEVGTGFHPELTGRENVYLNGAILGMTKQEVTRKFDEIVDFSGVEKFIDTPVKRYSSGMYVRLAFAVAAHLEPEILVVDEVLAVGDAEFQKKCLGKMDEVAHEGRTVLFVSHNMGAIDSLCSSGIFINNGHVVFVGSQVDTINQYLGSSITQEKNLLDRELREGTGFVRFSNIEFYDEYGHKISIVQSGQTIDVFLYYETRRGYDANMDVHVSLRFSTSLGMQIFSQNTRIERKSFNNLPQSGAFVCRIPRLPLPPSVYQIGCGIRVGEDVADDINAAISLTVIEGDYFKTGWTPTSHQGICLVDGTWHLRGSEI